MQISTQTQLLALIVADTAAFARRSSYPRSAFRIAVSLLALFVLFSAAQAQRADKANPLSASQQQSLRSTLNSTSLIVLTSHPEASYQAMAHDISTALGGSPEVRLLPIASAGGVENLRDLIFLRGADLAIVPANVLVKTKALENRLGAGVQQRLAYVSRLYTEEVHLLVGSGTATVEGLRGKKIAVPADDGTSEFTLRDLGERLGIEFEIRRGRTAEAIAGIRSGELAGALIVGGKSLQLVANLPRDGHLRLLGLSFSNAMEEAYLPAVFRDEDYPNLIPAGQTVDTIAVSAVLMANTGKGYEEPTRRLAKFVPAFFDAVADLTLPGTKPKWREINLASPLPGWTRYHAAEEWLRNAQEQQRVALQKGFEEFLRSSRQPGSPELTSAQRRRMLEDFVEWTRKSIGAAREAVPP